MKYTTEEAIKGTGKRRVYAVFFVVRGTEYREQKPAMYFDCTRHARRWAKQQTAYFQGPIIKTYLCVMEYNPKTEHYEIDGGNEI